MPHPLAGSLAPASPRDEFTRPGSHSPRILMIPIHAIPISRQLSELQIRAAFRSANLHPTMSFKIRASKLRSRAKLLVTVNKLQVMNLSPARRYPNKALIKLFFLLLKSVSLVDSLENPL